MVKKCVYNIVIFCVMSYFVRCSVLSSCSVCFIFFFSYTFNSFNVFLFFLVENVSILAALAGLKKVFITIQTIHIRKIS